MGDSKQEQILEFGKGSSNGYRYIYEIPPDAIRELIINAMVHRSYLDHGTIRVAVYDNRLEITSPGKLPMGQTMERMKEGYSSCRTAGAGVYWWRSGFAYQYLSRSG